MFTNYYRALRAEGVKKYLADAGENRIELLTNDAPALAADTSWDDIKDFRPDFPGYAPGDFNPLDMLGPTPIAGKDVISTIPQAFFQSGEGDGTVHVKFAAWIIRESTDAGPVNHVVKIQEIPSGGWDFTNDGDSKALTWRIQLGECNDEDEGSEGEEEGDDNVLMVDPDTSFSEDGSTEMHWG